MNAHALLDGLHAQLDEASDEQEKQQTEKVIQQFGASKYKRECAVCRRRGADVACSV